MRIDSHQHFWIYDPSQYGWMTTPLGALRRDYLPQHLEPLLRASGFDGSIAVQARQTEEETVWLLDLANAYSQIKGVVGWVDLRSSELPRHLERLSKHPKLVGVRHVVQDEADDQFMLGSAFRRGIRQLRTFGLAYDLLLFPKHLPVAVKLVEEFPEQPFVLDHLAKPEIRVQRISPWREDLQRLALFPNVYCKLSGMVTEAKWRQWRAEDFKPYLDAAFECFGPDRLMIGSDWPVCTVSGDYRATMQLVVDYVSQLAPQQRDGVLGDNCARFYRLKAQSGT
jgi:L-fuconolactonase